MIPRSADSVKLMW